MLAGLMTSKGFMAPSVQLPGYGQSVLARSEYAQQKRREPAPVATACAQPTSLFLRTRFPPSGPAHTPPQCDGIAAAARPISRSVQSERLFLLYAR